ncbi:helix-turn-helix transcriptional regulator [Allobranchiibius sp. GilTou38]|uniref:helix-turn-helix domain-containing protein n=1 Tax=Allobranchiibius sp. GilTou38 TaxID=2815210 RepID=UPI001AA102AD|nr:helix-turn-helix transcriptional regulator [Allobranchiibius sp. GilTou38]MBO1766817.1 helix-turn-helix transcriptional regulator [Allobranchiibius sp. GilTou38]
MRGVVPFPSPDDARVRRAARRGEPLWRQLLGQQLRRERTARAERLADVARRAGVSPQYLSEVERGRKEPSSEMLAAIGGALDLTLLDLTSRVRDQLAAGSGAPSSTSQQAELRLAA